MISMAGNGAVALVIAVLVVVVAVVTTVSAAMWSPEVLQQEAAAWMTMSSTAVVLQQQQQRGQEEVQILTGCRAPLVVFGASMMDVGERAILLPNSSRAEFPPYGLDYFSLPVGRFSNGRVITDFLSLGLGYGLLDNFLNSVGSRFVHGVSFACAGSTARNSTQSGSVASGLLPLDVQVHQYKLFKAKVLKAAQAAKHGGHLRQYLPTPKALSRAIHVMMQAHNDYVNIIDGPPYDPLTVVTSVIEAMGSSLRELYSMGARTMIVMNVLPIGCTPSFLVFAETDSRVLDEDLCVVEYNSLVELHNLHLQRLIHQLRVELAWDKLVVFDINAIYIDAIRYPSKYGVQHPLQACCGVGGKYNVDSSIPCGSKGTLNDVMVEARRCSSPTQYISWDGFHPTESFAKHIVDALLSGKHFLPSLSMQDACKGKFHGEAPPESTFRKDSAPI